MLSLYLFKHPILKAISQPLIPTIFLSEAVIGLLPNSNKYASSKIDSTGFMICSLFVFAWAVFDIFLTKSDSNSNENDETVNNNEESPKDEKFSLSNFDFATALFSVIMWITYMMDGMLNILLIRMLGGGFLQYFFHYILRFATLQFVYGLFINNQNVSKLFYIIYMAPQAVLWSIAAIISYYVKQNDYTRMVECFSCFNAIMSATLLYFSFKKFYQFPKYVSDDFKNKGIHFIFLIIGLLWYILVNAIFDINNYYYD